MRVAPAPGEGRDFESRRGRTKYSTTCTICRSVANNCLSTHLNDSSKVATARQEVLESTSMSIPNLTSSSQYRLHLSPLPPPPTLPPAEILKFFSRFGTPTEFYRPGLDGLGQERDYGFLGMDFGEKGEKGLSRCELLGYTSVSSRYDLPRIWVGSKTDYIERSPLVVLCYLPFFSSSVLLIPNDVLYRYQHDLVERMEGDQAQGLVGETRFFGPVSLF